MDNEDQTAHVLGRLKQLYDEQSGVHFDVAFLEAELERLQAENKEQLLDSLTADGEFIEMSGRLNAEVESVTNGLQAKLVTLQKRVLELEALTDPCPECDGEGEVFPISCPVECELCGGLGRVPKQPDTERIEIQSPDFMYVREVGGDRLYDANRDDGSEAIILTMLVGSGSWEATEPECDRCGDTGFYQYDGSREVCSCSAGQVALAQARAAANREATE